MKFIFLPILFCYLVLFLVGFKIGESIGIKQGIETMKQQAVDNQKGKWLVDKSGKIYFDWK